MMTARNNACREKRGKKEEKRRYIHIYIYLLAYLLTYLLTYLRVTTRRFGGGWMRWRLEQRGWWGAGEGWGRERRRLVHHAGSATRRSSLRLFYLALDSSSAAAAFLPSTTTERTRSIESRSGFLYESCLCVSFVLSLSLSLYPVSSSCSIHYFLTPFPPLSD